MRGKPCGEGICGERPSEKELLACFFETFGKFRIDATFDGNEESVEVVDVSKR